MGKHLNSCRIKKHLNMHCFQFYLPSRNSLKWNWRILLHNLNDLNVLSTGSFQLDASSVSISNAVGLTRLINHTEYIKPLPSCLICAVIRVTSHFLFFSPFSVSTTSFHQSLYILCITSPLPNHLVQDVFSFASLAPSSFVFLFFMGTSGLWSKNLSFY